MEVRAILAELSGVLEGIWEATPWQALLWEGDANAESHLFEARLNADPTHDTPIQTWVKFLAEMIPKVLSPVSVADWRPICLTSVLQKLYLSCVQKICEAWCSPVCDRLYGFRAGCQTAEVSETMRLAMQKSVLYNERLYASKADVA